MVKKIGFFEAGVLQNVALLAVFGFAWTKLGMGTAAKEIVNNIGIIPNGTLVEYIPAGLTKWSDAKTGIVTSTLMGTKTGTQDFTHLRYYIIDNNIQILAAYVRRA